jgi:cation:H+ antiporter
MNLSASPTWTIVGLFLLAATTIAVFGMLMTRAARDIAHRTQVGELLIGAVLIGAVTSLSGLMTSVTAAWTGHPELAVSNALGGIAAQTAFLAIADIAYRRANLEHAAASAENLMLCTFLLILLTTHHLGIAVPGLSFFGVHPVSIVLIAAYLVGLSLIRRTHDVPMWLPRDTYDTKPESEPGDLELDRPMPLVWLTFTGCAALVAAAGWLLAIVAVPLTDRTGLSESFVGGTMTAIASSLPELIVALAAVRMKALSLAVGNIIGGNAFDTLFVSVSDFAYRDGPIYAAISRAEQFWLALTALMTSLLLLGLLFRERHGVGNIGFESAGLLVIYVTGAAIVAFAL